MKIFKIIAISGLVLSATPAFAQDAQDQSSELSQNSDDQNNEQSEKKASDIDKETMTKILQDMMKMHLEGPMGLGSSGTAQINVSNVVIQDNTVTFAGKTNIVFHRPNQPANNNFGSVHSDAIYHAEYKIQDGKIGFANFTADTPQFTHIGAPSPMSPSSSAHYMSQLLDIINNTFSGHPIDLPEKQNNAESTNSDNDEQ